MKFGKPAISLILVAMTMASGLSGCASVDVTKTAKGSYAATVPDDIEILMTKPDRPYEELGTITAKGWTSSSTAKMHNALRSKAAPLGANAVVLTDTGLDYNGYLWGNGVAVRWK